VLPGAPAGWRNNPSQLQLTSFGGPAGERIDVAYGTDRTGRVAAVEVDGEAVSRLRVGVLGPEAVDLEVDGLLRRVAVARYGDVVDCDSRLGHTELVELDPFPVPQEDAEAGSLVAPLAGVVVKVAAPAGTTVEPGDLLVAIESMKVEYRVTAPGAGRVADVRVAEGERVEAGAVLVVFEPAA
jgi:propionyl-CoA carboxylase alpha chain